MRFKNHVRRSSAGALATIRERSRSMNPAIPDAHGRRQIGADMLEMAKQDLDVAMGQPRMRAISRSSTRACMSGRIWSARGEADRASRAAACSGDEPARDRPGRRSSGSNQYSRPPWRSSSRNHSSKLRAMIRGHAARARIARGEDREPPPGQSISQVDANGLDVGVAQLEPALGLHHQIVDLREDDHGTDGRDRMDERAVAIEPVGEHQPGSQSRRQAIAVAMLPGGDLPGIDARRQGSAASPKPGLQRPRGSAPDPRSIPPHAIQQCTSSRSWLAIGSPFTTPPP